MSRRRAPALSSSWILLASVAGCSHNERLPATGSRGAEVRGGVLDLLAFDGSIENPGWLPPGWEPHAFERVERPTMYAPCFEHGRPALRGHALAGASALRRRVDIAPSRYPVVEWTWRVASSVSGADCTRKETDDCAARILLLYRFEPGKVSFAERLEYESARAARGEYPPSAMLVYAWSEAAAPAGPFPSPYSDRVRIIAVERGDARARTWVTERRDHVADFRAAFGREPPPIESVAYMIDTDNTGGEATGWLGFLRFLASNGPPHADGTSVRR